MWWIILVAIVAVIVGLACLPVGLRVIYDKEGLSVKLLVGIVPFKLNLTEINAKKYERRMKMRQKMEENPDYEPRIIRPDGTLREFFPLLDLYLRLLFHEKYKLRVRLLELKLIMVNDDPFDLAMNYGKAWTIINGLMPQLERFLNIKKRKLDVGCDFLAEETMLYARVDLLIPLVRLIIALYDFIAAEMKK